ncbi:Transposable element Tcb2 transposase [Ceratobasidium theobromae]|uniref:Transposable element Tcb2 transposase n=1 Tax=Ceratobasidium theobromae TaxID=1582974 RepID=A0A5N5Q9S1_9AGAM|nr:Transposable element Tcb2 transposase [Ceratobasidium theobromae]
MAPNTSSDTKSKTILLKSMDYSDRAVAELLGNVHSSTISCIANRYANGRPVTEKTPRSGHPRTLTPSDVRFAALALTRLKPATAQAIKRAYFPHVSTPTIRRYLRLLGLRSYRRRRVPLLTRKHRKARFGWCQARLLWTQAQWDDIIFSDEARLKVFGSDGPEYYWKYPNQSPYDPRFTKKTWAAFTVLTASLLLPNTLGSYGSHSWAP